MSVFLRSVIVAISLLVAMPAWAANSQDLNVDITKLSPEVAKALVEDIQSQKKKSETPLSPPVSASQAKEWAGVGKEIAGAISETAKGLSLEVNQFVNTPVGWWAMFFLVWTILGAKVVKLIIGGLFVLTGLFVWWRSLKHFYWSDYEFANTDTQIWCSVFHVAGAGFLLVITCILIFGVL